MQREDREYTSEEKNVVDLERTRKIGARDLLDVKILR